MKKVLILIIVIFAISNSAWGLGKTEPVLNGGVYEISSIENLIYLSTADPATWWGRDFILTQNIAFDADETQVDWDGDGSADGADPAGFYPIGNNTTKFTGNFDGQGFTISNLYVNRNATKFIGLFGYLTNSTIENIGIVDCNFTGDIYVGGLVGANSSSSTISNSYATGTVTGVTIVGGLVGTNSSSSVSNSYATGTVTGGDYVGGLVGTNVSSSTVSNSYATGTATGSNYVGALMGSNTSASVSNSYATGTATGSNYVGGLVGKNVSSSTISNSYATGTVTGANYVGGLVGMNASSSTISNSYATGDVTRSSGTDPRFGGFCGYNNDSIIEYCYSIGSVDCGASTDKGFVGFEGGINTYTNNFWDSEASNQATSTGATPKTTTEMKTKNTFTNGSWVFVGDGGTENWNMYTANNNGYPYLEWQVYPAFAPEVTTTAISSITINSAISGGNITSNGGAAITARGVCYGADADPNITGNHTINDNNGTGEYTSHLNPLTEGTTYHVRAYATNSEYTSYGDDVEFTTVSSYSEIELWRYHGPTTHPESDAIADESNYTIGITNPSETIYDYEFTIINVGVGEAFTLTSTSRVVISGTNADKFSLQTAPASSVAAGGSTTFTIRYTRSILSTNDQVTLTIANTETVATDEADETTFVINLSVETNFMNVDVKFEDIDLNGKPEVGFGDDVTFDGSKTFDEAGYQLASDYAMSTRVIWLEDENAEANGYIVIDWDGYTYGDHYYCRSYIKYTDGTEVYGEISAFTRNEGSGLIKIGND